MGYYENSVKDAGFDGPSGPTLTSSKGGEYMKCYDDCEKNCIEPKETPSITDHKIEEMAERLTRIRQQLLQLTNFFVGSRNNADKLFDENTLNDIEHAFDEINTSIPYDISLQQKLETIDRWLEGIRVILCFCNDVK